MPVKPGQPIDPEATKARILDTCVRLFYERGVHSVGIGAIAARAGTSKLTIYRYFNSKDGLVDAVLRSRSDRVHEWIRREVDQVEPGRARVLRLFDLLAGWYREVGFRGCGVVNVAIETRGGSAAVVRRARAHLDRYLVLLRQCLREAGVAAPDQVARQLLILIEGATIVTAVNADPDVPTDTRRIVELLLGQ